MWIRRNRKRILTAILAIAVCALAAWALPQLYSEARMRLALHGCGSAGNPTEVENCIFQVIDVQLHHGGVGAAMHTFGLAYEEYPDFANGGCHTRAHKVGDMTYYEIYLGTQSFDSIDFPQETTACGYGFFHGLLEHYTQDHPTPEAVTKVCDYLIGRLGSRMGDIEPICYHGAGHGFTLAETERLTKKDWGNLSAFVTWPASECKALPKANAGDIEQCYEGIFNIIVDYMTTNQYGFTYDTKHPFTICFSQPKFLQQACIYEMAQKIDSLSGYDPSTMIKIVSPIADDSNRLMAFEVGMAGVIQQTVDTSGGYDNALKSCTNIPEPYYSSCVKSIAWGLYEHGDPQQEYKKVLAFCAEPEIATRGDTDLCYQRAAERLPRFYTTAQILQICPQFPEQYRSLCEQQVSQRESYGSGGGIQDPHMTMQMQ